MRRLSLLVLFIGNSFTYYNEMPTLLERVSASLGTPIVAHLSGHGGATMRNHWDEGKAVQAVRSNHYDFVVIQTQSSEIIRTTAETTKYARLLAAEIRKSGAKPVVFMTWPRARIRSHHKRSTPHVIGHLRATSVRSSPRSASRGSGSSHKESNCSTAADRIQISLAPTSKLASSMQRSPANHRSARHTRSTCTSIFRRRTANLSSTTRSMREPPRQ